MDILITSKIRGIVWRWVTFVITLTLSSFLLSPAFAALQLKGSVALPPTNAGNGNLAVNSNTDRVYVAEGYGGNLHVTVVDTSIPTSPVATPLMGGGIGSGVTVNPNTNRYYTADLYPGNIHVFDGASNTHLQTLPVGGGFCPGSFDVDPTTNHIYVTAQCGGSNDPLFVIDGGGPVDIIVAGPLGTGGINHGGVRVNPATGKSYANSGSNAAVFGPPPTFTPMGIIPGMHIHAVNPTTNRLYSNTPSGVVVLDGSAHGVIATIPVGAFSSAISVNTNLNRIYVGTYETMSGYDNPVGTIRVIDGSTHAVIDSMLLGEGIWPRLTTVDSSKNRLYVAVNDNDPNRALLVIEDTADTTPPDTTITASPYDPTASSTASFTFSGTDNVTPPSSLAFECRLDGGVFTTCSSPRTYSSLSDGAHTFYVRAIDEADNIDPSPDSHAWTVDTSPPVISSNVTGTLGANGWYVSDVTVTWTVSDPHSGIVAAAGCTPTVISTDTVGTMLTCFATNGVGLSSSASETIKLDKTMPEIDISIPADGGSYLLNATVAASYNCTDTTSGIASCIGSVPAGSNIDTGSVGTKTLSVDASDDAGNAASVTNTYKVIYDFIGFFTPVDNPPMMNAAKAGKSIPVKFSLNGDQGLAIFAAGYPKSQLTNCETSVPTDTIEETVTAGGSGLSYDSQTGQYIYVWKTSKRWSGTCRHLVVRLRDGTDHIAKFQFK